MYAHEIKQRFLLVNIQSDKDENLDIYKFGLFKAIAECGNKQWFLISGP